ncbi:xin actin-binding repeat-containing protein 1 [Brachionichthys hirsutus]|uniref:xin actin-binding repeat-containing protein 1 n=1 Tax=Brachionichthys hirsutus TaxID=412623 RepID=UPI003604E9BB
MAEESRKITVSQSCHDEDDLAAPPLPPPPPPPALPGPLDYEGPSESSSLPIPPPKETFSTFYQQRQKSELKRIFRHIHPDLRPSLHGAVDDEVLQAVQPESRPGDAAHHGEVQSMKWIFENWTLDNIGDPHATKKLLYDEDMKGGDVRSTSSKFKHIDGNQPTSPKRQTSVRGDVRTSTWLFETQPLDTLNQLQGEELVEAVLKEPIQAGDVRGTRQLFESKPLSDVGRCNSMEDHSLLTLTSELQEQRGDVQKTVKLFQADPRCAFRDIGGSVHEIKSVCREEINSSSISMARWLFETQPLDLINKGPDGVKIIRGISLEEGHKGGLDQKRWMFETQPLEPIQEVDQFVGSTEEADVVSKRKLFETQPSATLKGHSEGRSSGREDVLGGDVKTSLWLFETQPMETLSDSYEVGRLKNITLSADEQGDVKDKRRIFESCSFQKDTPSKQEVVEKGVVKGYKGLFEMIPLSNIPHSGETEREKASGNVKDKREKFETTPLYAIKDSSGNLHEVTTVSREESVKGKVQNYKWMFETKPLDELTEARGSVEVIKGITRQEDEVGSVKMAKWLFETQTIDGIHSKFNQRERSVEDEPQPGDVKTCKWLFETQPMDILYDKAEKVKDKDTADDSNVGSITWRFESQSLDSTSDGEEYELKLCDATKDSVRPEVGVQTVKHLFETETLDRIRKDSLSGRGVRRVSQINFQSGDVSRVKELFESQSLDEIGSELVATTPGDKNHNGDIEKGSVHTFTWMFENCPMSLINKDNDDAKSKKFIFQTSSLDKIHKRPLEEKCVSVSDVDVKSSTMMFETQPLYAIRDKEGQFHEVTTVKKEEVLSGDVGGARWMFETKPLDAIKAENDVYVIRAVTQEDVKNRDVTSARWKFETQPLDSLTIRDEPSVKVIEGIGGSNVQLSKQIFESEQTCSRFVRMVSVTDVQRGDVRTSTWLFENQAIDSLKGEPQEQGAVRTVHREDSQKGDVKRCTWLFESQPLDKIKESEDPSVQGTEEEIPKVDVKSTTWLFETTPLDRIAADTVADTLSYLCQIRFVHSSGIIVEANENQCVNMAKYLFESDSGVQIQKEEVVGGNIRNIVLQLLLKTTVKPQIILLREVEKGKVNTTVMELPVYETATAIDFETDQRMHNIVQVIDDLLVQDKEVRKGLIMQESAGGRAEMSVYSLICNDENQSESQRRVRGDVKSTIGSLLATASSQRTSVPCRVDEKEKGNVNLYKSCIEKGDLLYLKTLSGNDVDDGLLAEEHLEREAKPSLCQQKDQAERTISDVLPGDVKNTKKVFSSDCPVSVDNCVPREDIIPGDVQSAKQQLAAQPPIVAEEKDIVAGDIRATMESLERAKQQSMLVERELITPGTIFDMDLSAQGSEADQSLLQKEVIIAGDVKAAKKSLELAKQQSIHVERDTVVPGKIYNLDVAAQEGRSATSSSTSRSQPARTYPKVSDPDRVQERRVSFETAVGSDCAPGSLPSFVSCECNGERTEDETDKVIGGDVKAAIRSLQSAATEPRLVDKEDIVRGNVQRALQSLEKSRVNVSRGDYKAAMIYRDSGRACPERSEDECVVVSPPPTDTQLSPSISVTCEGQSSITTKNSAPSPVANGHPKAATTENVPPLPLKTSEASPRQKPVLAPKPRWMTSIALEDQHISPTSAPELARPVKEGLKNAAAHPKQRQPPPAVSTGRTQTGHMSKETHDPTGVDEAAEDQPQTSNGTEVEMGQNVIRRINAAEEKKNSAEDGGTEKTSSLKATLQNFERPERESLDRSKAVKVRHGETRETRQTHVLNTPQQDTNQANPGEQATKGGQQDDLQASQPTPVVLRAKKAKETEDERRQRLSVHKEEIMKGHVNAATLIFDNLRKREELKGILSQVREIEGESGSADVSAFKTFHADAPAWMDAGTNGTRHKTEGRKAEAQEDDLESVSSVEAAFEDLEKASKEIMKLKEQTLAKLLDIEEAIKKALYSVSSLKSEADISGLSGLFDESLKSEQNLQPAKNIRKISIVSSKARPDPIKETKGGEDLDSSSSKPLHTEPVVRQPSRSSRSSRSSPSFISIHSSARRPAQQPAPSHPRAEDHPQSTDLGQESCRSPAHRQTSVLQVKTGPEQAEGTIGTQTVSETYEETDGFGNVFVSSVTSRFFTKQSGSPAEHGAMTSPLTRRPEDNVPSNAKDGAVFVTFSQPQGALL